MTPWTGAAFVLGLRSKVEPPDAKLVGESVGKIQLG